MFRLRISQAGVRRVSLPSPLPSPRRGHNYRVLFSYHYLRYRRFKAPRTHLYQIPSSFSPPLSVTSILCSSPLYNSFKMAQTESKDAGIPVIDISNPSPEIAEEVLHAASTHGFLFIKNNGITLTQKDIDTMFDLVWTVLPKLFHRLTLRSLGNSFILRKSEKLSSQFIRRKQVVRTGAGYV
jgi:hypothetical protein